MRPETGIWWEQSLEDLDTAAVNIKAKKYYASAFFSQQAAEKALKAVYLEEKKELAKVHDLSFLAKALGAPEDVIGKCRLLSRVYIETRYPTGDSIPAKKFSKEDSEGLLAVAKEVLSWTRKRLS